MILVSCLTKIKSRRRKKGWKALLRISIDCGKSLKLEVKFFFGSKGIDTDESLTYTSRNGIYISCCEMREENNVFLY